MLDELCSSCYHDSHYVQDIIAMKIEKRTEMSSKPWACLVRHRKHLQINTCYQLSVVYKNKYQHMP